MIFKYYVAHTTLTGISLPSKFLKKINIATALLITIASSYTVYTNELLLTLVHKLRKCVVLDLVYKLNINK